MNDFDRRYRQHPSIVSRNIGGEVILVPIRKTLGELDNIYTLNETAATAWELFDGRPLSKILERIVEEYEVTPEQAGEDLLELVEQLSQVQAIEAVGEA